MERILATWRQRPPILPLVLFRLDLVLCHFCRPRPRIVVQRFLHRRCCAAPPGGASWLENIVISRSSDRRFFHWERRTSRPAVALRTRHRTRLAAGSYRRLAMLQGRSKAREPSGSLARHPWRHPWLVKHQQMGAWGSCFSCSDRGTFGARWREPMFPPSLASNFSREKREGAAGDVLS